MGIKITKIHIGDAIAGQLKEKEMTQRKFAEQLGCAQPEITRLLRKSSLDTDKLFQISIILDHNFFEDFKTVGKAAQNTEDYEAPLGFSEMINRIEQLAVENSKLKDIVGEKNQYISELENKLSNSEEVKKVV